MALPERLVRHELLLHGEEVIDLLDLRLGDDRPERFTRDIREQTKRFLSHFFRAPLRWPNFSTIWRTFPGLQCRTSRMTYMAHSSHRSIHAWNSTSFAAAMRRPSVFDVDTLSNADDENIGRITQIALAVKLGNPAYALQMRLCW